MGILIRHGDTTFDASAVIRYMVSGSNRTDIPITKTVMVLLTNGGEHYFEFASREQLKAFTDRIDSCHVLFDEMEADRKRMMINLGMSA